MTTAMRTTATKKVPMDSLRKTALVAGVFYLITFISIPTLALYGPVKNHRDWILSSGGHTAVLVGGFLEVIVALAGIGTAVTLYPVVKRQNEGAAPGFVAARSAKSCGPWAAGAVSVRVSAVRATDFPRRAQGIPAGWLFASRLAASGSPSRGAPRAAGEPWPPESTQFKLVPLCR